jgi:hypothetical protein
MLNIMPLCLGTIARLFCARRNLLLENLALRHFNVTRHPTSLWVVQQLREAFPYESAPRFLIFDRDARYGTEVSIAIRSMKIKRIRTSLESPCAEWPC